MCRLLRSTIWMALILLLWVGGPVLSHALTPEEERATFRLADDALVVELAAAEPETLSPVAMAFDADGGLFVAEMLDYPNASTLGRVRLLQDRDGDGRYETASIYADNLPFPNGVLPWNGGVLITAAPDIWFCKDTDSDGRADERRVLFTGFGLGNQQLRVNGLTWGLDNWVYGANGRSEGEIRKPEDSASKAVSIRSHDFRFRPDTGDFEAIAGRAQFGMTRDDWGNRFTSWNTLPIRHEVLPERYLNRNLHLITPELLKDILEPGDTGRVFPLAPPPLTFNNESVRNFNALAGLTVYRGDALGQTYRGNAFVGESLLNLIHRRVLDPEGVTFVARRGERDKEFLASTDPWFHPVNFATGPDGALYVADFYRRFVEHPDWVRGPARNTTAWQDGAEHGRIWRIRRRESTPAKRAVNLGRASTMELVRALEAENGWWRDTAQRLLVERRDRSVVESLEALARTSPAPLARLHALHTLEGLEALTPVVLLSAVQDPHPGMREHAVRLSEPFLGPKPSSSKGPSAGADALMDGLRRVVLALAADSDSRVRLQVALSAGACDGEEKLAALSRMTQRNHGSRWHTLAILSSVGSEPWQYLRRVVEEETTWLDGPSNDQKTFLDEAARLVGANHSEADLAACLTVLSQPVPASGVPGRLAILTGLAEGMARSPRSLRVMIDHPPDTVAHSIDALRSLVGLAAERAASSKENLGDRLAAISILGRVTPPWSGQALLGLLQPGQPDKIQGAAARALAQLNDVTLASALFADWSQRAAATRRQVLSVAGHSTAMTTALGDALDHGSVSPVELEPSVRQAMLKTADQQLRQRLEKRFASAASKDREEVLRRFQTALSMEGDRRRGALIFARTCLLCHTVEGRGQHVGPDLSGIASRPKEALLADILDPSRQVSPDFINYTLVATDGQVATGFILTETAASVTLRRAGGIDDTLLRSQIVELRAEGTSLMPEGLEQGLAPEDMADLLAFLQKPEGTLLPESR